VDLPPRAYLPDLLYAGGKVLSGTALSVKDGAVLGVGEPEVGCEWVRLKNAAILPGLVSAHSHAFQRAIRGRTEYRARERSDFWAWREAMYRAAGRLDPDDLRAVARMAFHEMARAGITAVGEFHYLHRDPEGRPYADPNELAKQVGRAAREVGLRFALLRVAYARAGHAAPPDPLQRRFVERSVDEVLRSLDDLEAELCGDPLVSLGIAPHSVRACPASWIERLAAEAARRRLPLHLHLAEQPAEVAQCLAEHGVSPVVLLERLGALSAATTAVHAIHLSPGDVEILGRSGVTVCACPTTERNLGDGIVAADRLLAAGARLALGTDSNVQVDLLEDARALECHLRLVHLERAVLEPEARRAQGPPKEAGTVIDGLARRLYGFASAGGMMALGLPGGTLARGDPADFVVLSLDDPSLAGAAEADLLPAALFSLSRSAVRDVYVGGEPVILGEEAAPGRPAASLVARDFRSAMRRLWG
jgi:formimidoylglutamate deiminase